MLKMTLMLEEKKIKALLYLTFAWINKWNTKKNVCDMPGENLKMLSLILKCQVLKALQSF